MKIKQTFGNYVAIKLDPDLDHIVLKNGSKLHIDTEFDPDKHVVRTGEVMALPTKLNIKLADMPWDTDMEIQVGDHVVMYYLAVQNCLAPEQKRYIKEDGETTIFIKYHNIYAVVRDDKIIPVNGFVLVEPIEDPEWIRMVEHAEKLNLVLPDLRQLSKTNVSYGRVVYAGKRVRSYKNRTKSDNHIEVKPGDEVIMKKIRDIPMEYEYHTKLDGGRKLFRMHRADILAVL